MIKMGNLMKKEEITGLSKEGSFPSGRLSLSIYLGSTCSRKGPVLEGRWRLLRKAI
jgi:hypothetical protein